MLAAFACVFPATAGAASGGLSPDDPAYKPAAKAKLVNGKAIPPRDAPPAVVKAIEAANRIVEKPYRYGGGHGKVEDSGYDCSGTVSYALIGAGLLKTPMPSGSFTNWGKRGRGKWITTYANGGHMFVMIAGLRLDTGGRDATANGRPGSGPRWMTSARSSQAYSLRHPSGF